jgi:hypothetical protein
MLPAVYTSRDFLNQSKNKMIFLALALLSIAFQTLKIDYIFYGNFLIAYGMIFIFYFLCIKNLR